jgi:hypothetical protein
MLGCRRLKFDRRFVALRGKPPEMPPETGEGLRVGQRAEMCGHVAIMLRPESDTPFHDPSI